MTVATEQVWHEDESKKKKISALSAFDGCSWGRCVCVCLPFYYFACVVQILFVVHISESGPNLSLIFLSSNGSRRQHCGDDDAYPPIAVFCIFRVVIYFDWCVFSWQSPMSLAPTRFFFRCAAIIVVLLSPLRASANWTTCNIYLFISLSCLVSSFWSALFHVSTRNGKQPKKGKHIVNWVHLLYSIYVFFPSRSFSSHAPLFGYSLLLLHRPNADIFLVPVPVVSNLVGIFFNAKFFERGPLPP